LESFNRRHFNEEMQMKVMEIISAAKAASPDAFQGINDNRAVRVVQAVLQEIGRQVEKTAEGPVAVGGLGTFVVRRVTPKAEPGKPTPTGPVRRVNFRAAQKAAQPAKA
jgi:hypothetical protein